jgi:small subunit ribosomal protein S20
MAHHKSAQKRIRSNERKRVRNHASKNEVKSLIRKVYSSADKTEAEKNLKSAVAKLDKAATKGIMHKNSASRKKAQITKYFNKLG